MNIYIKTILFIYLFISKQRIFQQRTVLSNMIYVLQQVVFIPKKHFSRVYYEHVIYHTVKLIEKEENQR